MAEELSMEPLNINFTDTESLTFNLKHYFKHPSFKNDKQRDVIKKILERKGDVLIKFPTGYGRSLCYQFPAVIHAPKVTIVFCSLPCRIKNNIDKLTSLNITAETLNEELFLNNQTGLVSDSYSKNITSQLLYVTIDQAVAVWFKKLFVNLINEDKLAFIVVDEIDCEKKWLYGQKNIYVVLGTLKKISLNIPWIILTNPIGSDNINFMITILNLKTPDSNLQIFSTPSFRPNLFYDVILEDEVDFLYQNFKEFFDEWVIKNVPESCGMVFCKTSKIAEEISTALCEMGVSITPYHNDLTEHEKHNIQEAFINGSIKIIAVTGAFGMKINNENVNLVVHWGLPLNILEYYQQSGQAGKNGKPAHCRIYVTKQPLLYYNSENHSILESALTETKSKNAFSSFLLFVHSRLMKDYCENLFRCRHKYFADYFGDKIPLCIDKCDICKLLPIDFFKGRTDLKDKLKKKGAIQLLKQFCKEYENLQMNQNITTDDTINAMKICDELVEHAKNNWILQSTPEEINAHMIENINDNKYDFSHSSSLINDKEKE